MGEGVTIRDYVDAALAGLHRRIDDLLSVSQRERDAAGEAIEKRLDDSARDRERIRQAQGNFITKTEFDLLASRVASLERSLARALGAIGVILLLVSLLGILLKYLTG